MPHFPPRERGEGGNCEIKRKRRKAKGKRTVYAEKG
jgi:hypothetical protein